MPILVVDDNIELAEVLAEILKGEFPQHDIDVGIDGAHALRLATLRRPHVVIMDLDMPVLGGVEAAKRMRHGMPPPPPLTLIGMSGNHHSIESGSARAAFDHMLAKPLDMDRLILLVSAA